MANVRRVNARDIAKHGSLETFVSQLIANLRVGNMETKERAAMNLRSLTEQPSTSTDSENVDNAVVIARQGGIKPLVSLVIIGSAVAQTHACAALANVAKNRRAYQEVILEAGGVLPICSALRGGDSHSQEQAAAALSSLSQLEASRKGIIKVGGIPPLVTLLKGASADTQIHAAMALANLSHGSPEGQSAIARAGALPLLIGLLAMGKTQEAVAHALARLTQDHGSNQAEVLRLGGVPRLVALLSVVNADAQAQAAAAIAAIASGESQHEKDVIAKAGGIRPLLALIDTRYTYTQRSAINAIAMLAQDHRSNQDSISTLGGIMPLVMITQAGAAYPPEVQTQTVLALTEIARHNEANQTAIVQFGAISSLVNLLNYSTSPEVKAEVAGVMWALSEDHPDNQVAIASAGTVPLLMPQLATTSDRAQANAAHAVASLAFSNTDNQAQAADLLVRMLEDGNPDTEARAAELLWRIVSENPDNHMIIAKSGKAEALVRLLTSRVPRAKAYALWSLSLSIDEESQKLVADAGGIRPLVFMLNVTNPKVNEQAACALQLLAHNNKETQLAIAMHGAIEPLITLLDRDDCDSSDRSQEYAAAALSDLALIPANKLAIDRGGGIQPLVALLSDTHRQLNSKKYAAAALARLSTDESQHKERDEQREQMEKKKPSHVDEQEELSPGSFSRRRVTKAEVIAEAGAIGPLVDLLNGDRGPEAQEEAAGALWALADHSINRKAITEYGGIGPLVELLGCPNFKARQHAEAALVRLSIENVNRVLIIKQLVGMLQESSGTAAQEQAAAALANLARESTENRTSILDAGGVPRLLALLNSNSPKAKENSVSAVAQLTYKNQANQNAVAEANGIPSLVATVVTASANVKELSLAHLCTLTASAIWNLADGNPVNQTLLMKEGAIPPIVALITNPSPEMQTNAAGALAVLARDHPENQLAIAKSGAIAPLCTMVRDGSSETREESAAALWTLATNNPANKATIAKLGGIEPLVSMLMHGTSEKSSIHAASALAALAKQHSENCAIIIKRMVTTISTKAAPPRAVRLLNAVAALCDNEPMNQIAMAKMGGIQPLIPWLEHTEEEVQVQAARALLAVASNNSTTQSLIGKLGGVKPLVMLVDRGSLEAQGHACCALWHLATLGTNRTRIGHAQAFAPLVRMLIADGDRAPQLASMLILRLAEGSTKATNAVADAGGIIPLVKLLSASNSGTQQMATASLAALGSVSKNRDIIASAGAITPLIHLLTNKTLGTPETAARALGCLARNNGDDVEVAEVALEVEEAAVEVAEAAEDEVNLEEHAEDDAAPTDDDGVENAEGVDDDSTVAAGRKSQAKAAAAAVSEDESSDEEEQESVYSGEARRTTILREGGIPALISMLDGSNLCGKDSVLKPPVVGGWTALKIGIAGCIESKEIFPGSQVDFGVRIGMQEQAASTLADLSHDDLELQDAILECEGVAPLLSLVRSGSSLAQEHSARAIWHLSSSVDNQRLLIRAPNLTIRDLVILLKEGSLKAQYFAAAGLSELAHGAIQDRQKGESKRESSRSPLARRASVVAGRALAEDMDIAKAVAGHNASQGIALPPQRSNSPDMPHNAANNRLLAINEAGGVVPLVKLAENGTPEGKEKAASAIWHLALDRENQSALAANGAIKPLVALFGEGTEAAKKFASLALTRLALANPDNQAQIAKRLVGLLDHDDSSVVSLAALDLQSLAQDHPGAPIVIVNAGAISPLVSVLSNGKTDEGRQQAAKTLHTLANSGPANQLAIAIGLVALLGVGSDNAQEYVTELLLTLTSVKSDSEADIEAAKLNRRAIANAGPFRMLVMQLRSNSAKVKALASAVLSQLSGDSEQNVTEIANVNGISPLVALQGEGADDTKQNVTAVLADMTRNSRAHASSVVSEGGITLTVDLLRMSDSIDTQAYAADMIGSIAIEHALQIGASGAIVPLVHLLEKDNKRAMQKSARALAGIAAGGKENQDWIKEAGGVELLVGLLRSVDEEVQSMAAGALAELARNNSGNQLKITECGGIQPLIALITKSSNDQPKTDAARTLWSLSDKNFTNQGLIAKADGIKALISVVGHAGEVAQVQASGAIASLALDNSENLAEAAKLLVKLLDESGATDVSREKAARSISHFASANAANQDALAFAGCGDLLVSLLNPKVYQERAVTTLLGGAKVVEGGAEHTKEGSGKHHLTHKGLCGALWSLTLDNSSNQASVAKAGGIPMLIALLSDHPEIRREAAGALWSLGADSENQRMIAEEGGIPKLVDLLKYGKNNTAQDTAAGALHSLAARPENRDRIADADGISLLIPLFDGCSTEAKHSVSGALLTLAIDNTSNQFNIASKLVALLASGPDDAKEAMDGSNDAMKSRLEAQEHATRVLYTMTMERDYKEALSRTGAISQLVRQLKGGTEATQQMAANALSQIARMSGDLRVQVTQQLVALLGSPDAEVRQRAGAALRENNTSDGGEDTKSQREAAMAGGVASLVELLKAGLSDNRVEAQEYSLWSLSVTTDPLRCKNMVEEGCIPALIQSLRDGKLREDSKEHAAMVLASLAIESVYLEEIVRNGAITQLVELLTAEHTTMGAKKQAALGLARLTHHGSETQILIAEEGAITPLVQWLRDPAAGPSAVAAFALSELARDNHALQVRIAEAEAIPPLVAMLREEAPADGYESACSALASLARLMPANQEAIALADGIPSIVELLKKPLCEEEAANALSTLADNKENKMLIFKAGGIRPLVALLTGTNSNTQRHTAKAIESLARDTPEIQDVLAAERASNPLVGLLSSESIATQESAVRALLCLASHPASRTVVVVRLVGGLLQRNTAAQLKACEALAVLAARSSVNRTAIVHAGAINPLVSLLGNGSQSQKNTPPERAAAVLAELARFSEGKVEIAQASGIEPLVTMLGSTCGEARTHAACALRHLSAVVENKATITDLGAIPRFVLLLSDGIPEAERHSASALWQLATTAEAKTSIMDAGGIPPLVELLRDPPPSETPADEKGPKDLAIRSPETKEAAAAMLSELARLQGDNKSDIVKAGGVSPLAALMHEGSPAAQKYAACTLWGIAQETKYRRTICEVPFAIDHLVELLRKNHEETQGFAASTLVCLAQEKDGREQIMALGGAGPLMTIAMGPTSWLRSRCVEALKLLGYPDPLDRDKDGSEKKPLSPRLSKYQDQLAKNPAIWMVPDGKQKLSINDEHMADIACKIKEGDRVIVDPGNRKAEVRFVGKIPEIAKGYWVGVQYDEAVGKNDGSVKGRRCFECTHDFGGFLRPNHIRVDHNPPPRQKPTRVKADDDGGVEANAAARAGEGVALARKPRKVKDSPVVVAAAALPPLETPLVMASAYDTQETDRSVRKGRPAAIARVVLKKQPPAIREQPTIKEQPVIKEKPNNRPVLDSGKVNKPKAGKR